MGHYMKFVRTFHCFSPIKLVFFGAFSKTKGQLSRHEIITFPTYTLVLYYSCSNHCRIVLRSFDYCHCDRLFFCSASQPMFQLCVYYKNIRFLHVKITYWGHVTVALDMQLSYCNFMSPIRAGVKTIVATILYVFFIYLLYKLYLAVFY